MFHTLVDYLSCTLYININKEHFTSHRFNILLLQYPHVILINQINLIYCKVQMIFLIHVAQLFSQLRFYLGFLKLLGQVRHTKCVNQVGQLVRVTCCTVLSFDNECQLASVNPVSCAPPQVLPAPRPITANYTIVSQCSCLCSCSCSCSCFMFMFRPRWLTSSWVSRVCRIARPPSTMHQTYPADSIHYLTV